MHIQPPDKNSILFINESISLSSGNKDTYIQSETFTFYLSDKEVIMIILSKIRIKPPIVQG